MALALPNIHFGNIRDFVAKGVLLFGVDFCFPALLPVHKASRSRQKTALTMSLTGCTPAGPFQEDNYFLSLELR